MASVSRAVIRTGRRIAIPIAAKFGQEPHRYPHWNKRP
jgi:hypothetical protein